MINEHLNETEKRNEAYWLIMQQNRKLISGMQATKRLLWATMITSTLFIFLALWDFLK